MASHSRAPEPDVEEDFECPICKDVLRMPVRTKNCKHVFCRSCLDTWLRTRGLHCPLCRGPLTETQRRATDVQQRMRMRKGVCRACGSEREPFPLCFSAYCHWGNPSNSCLRNLCQHDHMTLKPFSKMRLHYKTCRKYIEEYGPIINATPSTSVQTHVQIPVQTHVQIPVQTLVQTPVQSLVQTLVPIPVQTHVQIPVQTPVQTLVQIPVQTPVQTLVPVPVQTPVVLPCSGFPYITVPAPSNSGGRVYSCPYCPLVGLVDIALVQHCMSQHSTEAAPAVCPICARMPWGNGGYYSPNLIAHLRRRHRFSYTNYMDEEEDEDIQVCRALQMSIQE